MQFDIDGYPDYKYDDIKLCVISFKGNRPRQLQWVGRTKNVVLYKNGFRRTFTALEIMTKIRNTAEAMRVAGIQKVTDKEGVAMANKFIIGSKSANGFSFASKPVEHDNEVAARTEAERLARSNPGKTFVVVKIVGSVVSNAVSWK